MSESMKKVCHASEILGETIGTFLLTLFGCGSVAVAVLYDGHKSLFEIALVWGIGVTLAIYLTRHLSCAHLNPAVSFAMALSGRMKWRKVPVYILSQFLGAFLAGLAVYALFYCALDQFEIAHNISRGSAGSQTTAKIFGEFYTNIPMLMAVAAEAFGTFLLVILIFSLTEGCNAGRPDDALVPCFIGLGVTSIICLIAPLTQAGLNPARDFSPRMVAMLAGWGNAAFPDVAGGFFWVYIAGPLAGAMIAAVFFTGLIEPVMKNKKSGKCCCKGAQESQND